MSKNINERILNLLSKSPFLGQNNKNISVRVKVKKDCNDRDFEAMIFPIVKLISSF